MKIAAFLPQPSLEHLLKLLPHGCLAAASSWIELDRRLDDPDVMLALIDPSADGITKIGAASRLVSTHRDVPFVGYVPLTHANMKAIVTLSRRGLAHALLHPSRNAANTILFLANEFTSRRLAYEFLGFFETRLMTLAPELANAVQDLLERPQRYYSAADLARESSVSRRYLYRAFKKACLGSPKKFVVGAKLLRAYAYLRTGSRMQQTAKELGYAAPRVLGDQTAVIFGCSVSHLAREQNAGEVVLELVEWIYKPPRQTLHNPSAMNCAEANPIASVGNFGR